MISRWNGLNQVSTSISTEHQEMKAPESSFLELPTKRKVNIDARRCPRKRHAIVVSREQKSLAAISVLVNSMRNRQ